MKVSDLKIISKELRLNVLEMLGEAGSGHTAGSLGMADVFSVLYFDRLKLNPKNPNWSGRDYFILSNGHICPILYASLAKKGFFKRDELFRLRKINSLLQGHPHNTIPGVENSSGPLAQGISFGVGVALTLKLDAKDNSVFVTCGDGELDEGECWEAFMLASKNKLSNFTLIVDYNGIQLDGNVSDVMPLNDLGKKFDSFGFKVFTIDGNDISEIKSAIAKADRIKSKPKVILAKTIPGKGVSFIEGDYRWHGKVLQGDDLNRAIEGLFDNE